MAAASLIPKADVGFEHPAKGPHHCRECRHYLIGMRCRLVAGRVEPGDWCELFEARAARSEDRHAAFVREDR